MSSIYKLGRRIVLTGLIVAFIFMAVLSSAHSQDPTRQKIESDDPAVVRTGTWSSQPSAQASGGSYLYNAPSSINGDDVALSLQFAGPSLEILYVSGPNLGTMAIEIDGVVLRTVITTAAQTAYQQATTIDYLTDEDHTLRVYAQAGGVIGVDAFVTRLPNAPGSSSQVTAMNGETSSRIPCIPNGLPQLVSLDENGNQIRFWGGGEYYALNGDYPDISADGRYVVFHQRTHHSSRIYEYDRQTCTTTIVPEIADGSAPFGAFFGSPAISGDGRYVVFTSSRWGSDANGNTYLYDRPNNTTYLIAPYLNGQPELGSSGSDVAISGNGRYVVYVSYAIHESFPPGNHHIVVRDLQTGLEKLANTDIPYIICVNSEPDISADGQLVVFKTEFANGQHVENIYLKNFQTQTTSLLSASPNPDDIGNSYEPAISADGRYVAFVSEKQFLVPKDTNGKPDVFVRDLQTGSLTRVSIYSDGSQVDADAIHSVTISGDGRYVGFTLYSGSSSPRYIDVFIHDRQTRQTYVVSRHDIQTLNYGESYSLAIADYAPVVVFRSSSSTLAPGDLSDDDDVYVNSLTAPAAPPSNTDTLALINPTTQQMSLIDTIADPPPPDAYTTFTSNARASGLWVMGDWDGDGDETPGVYEDSGAFRYTNDLGSNATWRGVWFGFFGKPPVVGRFDPNVNHDCVGVIDSALFDGSTGFALYYACNLTGTTTPPLGVQWLGFLLQNSSNFQGDFQFAAGDFDADGVDTIAVRRGIYVSWTNTIPTTLYALYNFAQYWGASLPPNDYGLLVAGDWNNDAWDSFGFMFQNGDFAWRNDLLWNNGGWSLTQHTGLPVGTPIQAFSWR